MYAIIKTGGKQYKVAEGDKFSVEKLDGEKGDSIVFDSVLLINDGKKTHIGEPALKSAKVEANLLDQIRDDKVIIFKKKRRHNYRRKKGHRQYQTILQVKSISL